MAVVTNRSKPRPYVLEADRKLPEDKQTTWLYRRVSPSLKEELEVAGFLSSKGSEANAKQLLALRAKVVEESIVGWANLKDEDGNDVLFPADPKTGKANTRAVREIVTDFADELFTVIVNGDKKTADDQDG